MGGSNKFGVLENIKIQLGMTFAGLSKTFFILLFITCAAIIYLTYIISDNTFTFISLFTAISGILYVFFAGEGKIICFIFGLMYSFCYSYIAYTEKLYGEVMLNIFYIFINIMGLILWYKNHNEEQTKIIIRHTPKKELLICFGITAIATVFYGIFLSSIDASFAYLNAFSVVAQLVAFYLQIKRYVENYMLVTIANIVSVIFWAFIIKESTTNVAQFLNYVIFLILGIIFWFKWHKEAQ